MNKKFVLVVLLFAIIISSTGVFALNIATCADLAGVTGANTYVLTADINCGVSPYTASTGDGKGFPPIASFSGSIDGMGFKIKKLFIYRNANNQGLFATISAGAIIKNLIIEDANVTGAGDTGYIGILFGQSAADVNNCRVSGIVANTLNTWNAMNLGGMGGKTTANINNSRADVNINANSPNFSGRYVGGLVGQSTGNINYSSANGSYIYAKTNAQAWDLYSIGGLVGDTTGNVTDSNAIFGDINGYRLTGGLVGSTTGNVTNSFAQVTLLTGTSQVGGLVGYTTGKITNSYARVTQIIATGNYIGGLLGQAATSTGVTGSYAIATLISADSYFGGLVGSTDNDINSSYAIVTDINSSSATFYYGRAGGIAGAARTIRDSNSIGRITGKRTNLDTSNVYVGGLVGEATGSVINSHADTNIDLINSTVSTRMVGGLAGSIIGDVNNSYATYYLIRGGPGPLYYGGLVGNSTGNINSSYATGTYLYANTNVNGWTPTYLGGLVGNTTGNITGSSATLTDLNGLNYVGGIAGYSTGAITSTTATLNGVIGTTYLGGLAGAISGASTSSTATVTYIKGTDGYIGGLIGSASGAITTCTATIRDINASGAVYNGYIGGLVGTTTSTITGSHATSKLNIMRTNNLACEVYIGGLVGNTTGYVKTSYADTNIDANTSTVCLRNIGGLVGSTNSDVNDSYTIGNMIAVPSNANNYRIGGLVGNSSATINNSYSTIGITAGAASQIIGGLVGAGTTVRNSFSIGSVSAGGASVGKLIGTITTVSNSYYMSGNDVNLYPTTLFSAGAGTTYFKANPTGEPMNDWNFSGVWYNWAGEYPKLNPSAIVTYYTNGTFISKALDLSAAKKFTTLDFRINKPADTNILFQLRSATSSGGLNSALWLGPDGTSASYYSTSGTTISSVHDGNSFVQWKALLSSTNNQTTPSIYDVNIRAIAMGEAIFSKTSTAYSWVSFTPTQDTNGCTINWYYSLSNSPYSWVLSSSVLSGSSNLWLRALISGSTDSNNMRIGGVSITYAE